MPSDYSDEGIAKRLRSVLDGRKLTIKEASEAVDVPYRTLQNQLLGRNKMPASTFAKLLSFLELPPQFIAAGRYEPDTRPIADALKWTFGALLPAVDSEMRLIPPPAQDRSAEVLDRHANAIAFLYRVAYEREILTPEDVQLSIEWLSVNGEMGNAEGSE